MIADCLVVKKVVLNRLVDIPKHFKFITVIN